MPAFDTFAPGQRVEMHPATDWWMRGARYGTVQRQARTGTVTVKLDLWPRPVRVHPDNLIDRS
jgi:hypothetical protein